MNQQHASQFALIANPFQTGPNTRVWPASFTKTQIRASPGESLDKSLDTRLSRRFASKFSKRTMLSAGRTIAPFFLALAVTTAAHAQGTIGMSGAPTLMTTVKTFAEYAGAVICLISLILRGCR